MNAFERRDIHEANGISNEHDAVTAAPIRKRVVPSLGDCLGPPFQELPALELGAEERMQLHPLQELMHVEVGVVVIEADDKAECNLGGTERIHEAATEGIGRQRPAQRMDDSVERTLRLPNLLYAERIQLRIGRADLLPLTVRLRQETPGPLCYN